MGPSILIADKMSPKAAALFTERGLNVIDGTAMSDDEKIAALGTCSGLLVRSKTSVPEQMIGRANGLKVIGRAGIGVDHIDIPAASKRGIVVMNAPSGNATTTAEHAVSMMMALARQIPQASASTKSGKWEKSKFMGVELAGKTLGVVGCGNIGSLVVTRAQGLQMKVIVHDPFLTDDRAKVLGISKCDLDDLYQKSDFITLHVPATDQTTGMINKESLAKMKPGVRLINCARGKLVVEEDLKQAILSGHIAGAALDVFAAEPAHENPLFELDEVICTPHLGASTSEAQESVAVEIARQMSDFLLEGSITNALNVPALTAEEAKNLAPYLTLAGQMGCFAGQINETGVKSVSITFAGHAAGVNNQVLVSEILCGLLSPVLENVNRINALPLAKSRGIDVSQTRIDEDDEYQTLIRIDIQTERRAWSVSGTLFGAKARIVELENVPIEAEITPHMLLVRNEDKPGFIGSLGGALGKSSINIASFHLGREEEKGRAIALLALDQKPDQSVLDEINALPYIVAVRYLRFL